MKHNRTWFPILLGVVFGLIASCIFANHEPSVFWIFTGWLFNEKPPVKIIEPDSLHFMLYILTLSAAGGFVGVFFSEWRARKAVLFLLAILAAISLSTISGNYLQRYFN